MSTTTEDQDLNQHDGDEVIALAGSDTDIDPNEDRGDEVADAAALGSDDPDAGNEPTGTGIPRARFNEVNEQRKEAQRQLEQAQAEIERLRAGSAPSHAPAPGRVAPAAPQFDEDAAEEAYGEALLEGDPKKAAAIRREINAHIRASAAAEAQSIGRAEAVMAELDRVTQAALQEHPWLDTPAGEEALEMIVAVRDRKIAGGVPAHQALAQAVAAIAPKFAPDGASPGQGSPAAGVPADTRTRQALARGAAAANNQPPALQAGIGNRTSSSGPVNVEDLTEEQFAALSEAERAKLRGD